MILLMLNVPFSFMLSLNLLTYAKQTSQQHTQKRKEKTENVIGSDQTLGLQEEGYGGGVWQRKHH